MPILESLFKSKPSLKSPQMKVPVLLVVVAGVLLIAIVIHSLEHYVMPPSITAMGPIIDEACQNPDVQSEPAKDYWICASQANKNLLEVIALVLSHGDPKYHKNGAEGIVPIKPNAGNEIALWTNTGNFNPYVPLDSITVAARVIDQFIGGSSKWDDQLGRDVQIKGLETQPALCVKYTGSSVISRRTGLCQAPLTTYGQTALATDVFSWWMRAATGRAPTAKLQNIAAVLFSEWDSPGSPYMQFILHGLGYKPIKVLGFS